jgi:CubicO group peptidase (beta-lactamase class C family)
MKNAIQELLNSLVAEGQERGLQVAIYLDGQLAVSACAGVRDQLSGKPVERDTLFPVFSTTKGITATLIHLLAERRQVDYEQPISSIWPEFGANGKECITIRQALNHSAGIPQMPRGISAEETLDWEEMCKTIAALEPLWEPGTRMEYHAMTFGWILGEVARRVDGRPFGQMLEEEICRPLRIDTMFVGMPPSMDERLAILEEPGASVPVDDGRPQAIPPSVLPLGTWMNHPQARRACIPASNGIMNAEAIARHYAALLPGGVDGVELLPPARLQLATEPQRLERPENPDYPKDWGLGYKLGEVAGHFAGEMIFGHGGHGGSVGFAVPRYKLAFGFTKNLLNGKDTLAAILRKVTETLA